MEDALNKADLTTKAIPTQPVPKVKSKAGPAVSEPKPVEEVAPVTKQMEEAIPETIPAKIEEPLPEIKTELPPSEPSIYTTPVATTNLNKPKYGSDPDFVSDEAVRKSTLSSIKVLRQESFAAVKDAPEFAGIDPSAIAVAQGEYRAKIGREFNADSPTDVTAFAEFAQGFQKKLEDLREQYKDMPPKILIHGTDTERTPAKVKRGFFDPQTIGSKKHMELEVGATSFTSDLRLNYRDDAFGGPVVKNISYTEIPYADYMFRRVDMPLSAYTKKDMNTIARTITGDPTVARPLSLPRNLGYKETEDAFVESEKLKIQTDFNKIEKQYKLIEQQETNRKRLTNKLLDVVNRTDKDGLTLIDNIIILNNNEAGTPSQNAGIEVERGTSTNVVLRWNETDDCWEFTNDGTTYQRIFGDTVTNAQTAAYTLVLADRGKMIEMNVGSGNNLTVPSNANVAYPVGTTITVLQTGAGQTTIAAQAGVTVNATPGLKLRTQWSSATLIKRATDTWVALGDLAA